MMLVEPDGVLFAGDIVQNGRIPHMNSDDVSTTQWLAALGEVERLDPKFIIPGHGKASTEAKQAIAFTRDYIQYVRSAMTTAVQDWTDFDVAYEKTDWSKYRDMPAFAANNRGNAYRIYLELEQSQFKADKLEVSDAKSKGMAEYVVEFGKDGRPVEPDGRLDAAAFHRNHQPIWAVLAKIPRWQIRRRARGRQRHRAACGGFRAPNPELRGGRAISTKRI